MEAKYFKIMAMPMEDIMKLLQVFEQNSKITQTEAGRKAAEEFKKELRKIREDCEKKMESAIDQPSKEIKFLRQELDEIKREYANAKNEWELKFEEKVKEITKNLTSKNKENKHSYLFF
jgi:polyhydroxyalkanoate synthesis regulator phasin